MLTRNWSARLMTVQDLVDRRQLGLREQGAQVGTCRRRQNIGAERRANTELHSDTLSHDERAA